MANELVVLGVPRDVCDDYPGEFGTLALLQVSPPIDVGEFRCIPQMRILNYSEVLPSLASLPGGRTVFAPPALDDIPDQLDGIRVIGKSMVFRHCGATSMRLLALPRHGTDYMSAIFDGTVLRFRMRNLVAQLDCRWASGVIGLALLRWQPGRIWVEYFAPGIDGACKMQSASSDNHAVDATEFLVSPGENWEELRAVGAAGVPETPFSLAVALVCRRKLDHSAIMGVMNLYGNALKQVVVAEEGGQDVFAGKIFIRCTTLAPRLFDLWSSATRKPPGWNGEATSLIIPPGLSRAEVEELQDLQVYALTSKMVEFCAPSEEVPCPKGLQGRNIQDVFWFHVAEGHILDGADHWRLRDEIQSLAWDCGKRLVLQCRHLETLYDAIGREWLAEEGDAVSAQLGSKRINARMNKPIHPLVAGWLWLRGDVIIDEAAHHDLKLRSWALLTMFANDLEPLDKRVQAELVHRMKTKDYRQTAFEASTAALLSEAGASVDFVATGDLRSPDLRASMNGVQFFVECSHKKPHSDAVEKAQVLANELATMVLSAARKHEKSVKVEIQLAQLLSQKTRDHVFNTVKRNLRGGHEDTGQVSISVASLGEWSEIHDADHLAKSFDGDTDQVFLGGTRRDGWSMTTIMQASVVGIGMKRERDIVKSVLATLKSKGRWTTKKGQIPEGTHGVIAIGLGDCRSSIAERVAKAVAKRFERHHRSVATVMLVWDERSHEASLTTEIRTFCLPIPNKNAECPLPGSVRLPRGQVRVFGSAVNLGPPVRR